MPECEIVEWKAVSIEQALKLEGRVKRCPECHGEVRAHNASASGMAAHFEHYVGHAGCSLGNSFDGTKRPHPKPIEY